MHGTDCNKERYLFNVPRRASLPFTPSPFAEMTVSDIQAAATCQLGVSSSRPSTNSRVPLQNRRDHLHASDRFTTPLGWWIQPDLRPRLSQKTGSHRNSRMPPPDFWKSAPVLVVPTASHVRPVDHTENLPLSAPEFTSVGFQSPQTGET